MKYFYTSFKKYLVAVFASMALGAFGQSEIKNPTQPYWKTIGNAGSVDGTHFLGTTDNIPFTIRVNNQSSGRIDPLLSNSFWGYWAGRDNSTGTQNTAIGINAMLKTTTGGRNTAVGGVALEENATGTDNTAVGFSALFYARGSRNTAVGAYSFSTTTNTAVDNTAAGYGALYNNTGDNNTGVGSSALTANTSGNNNTAIGVSALQSNTTGVYNTAVGRLADVGAGGLVNATAIGAFAQVNSSNSIVLGSINGLNGATASARVGIGIITPAYALEVSSGGFRTASFTNTTTSADNYGVFGEVHNTPGYGFGVYGYGGSTGLFGNATMSGSGNRYGVYGTAQGGTTSNYGIYAAAESSSGPAYGVYGTVSGSGTMYAGYFQGNVYCTGSYLPSDEKLKENIAAITNPLKIITALQPRSYLYKTGEYGFMNLPEGIQYGFVAGELKEVLPTSVAVAIQPPMRDPETRKEVSPEVRFDAINYNSLIPVLVASVQQQQQMIDSLNTRNEQLLKRVEELEKK